ncbi:hypothetical protein IQ07DRAFT_194068 [Pyrenochaeta sp. DS3sAY3a]|nr:hypothetical protein IQ07DRAFT_194068 [Pyrenochaeta sp. DS3sAY3a]
MHWDLTFSDGWLSYKRRCSPPAEWHTRWAPRSEQFRQSSSYPDRPLASVPFVFTIQEERETAVAICGVLGLICFFGRGGRPEGPPANRTMQHRPAKADQAARDLFHGARHLVRLHGRPWEAPEGF